MGQGALRGEKEYRSRLAALQRPAISGLGFAMIAAGALRWCPSHWLMCCFVLGALLVVTPWVAPRSPIVRSAIVGLFAVILARYWYFRVTATLPWQEPRAADVATYLYAGLELCIAYFSWQSVKSLIHRTDRTPEADAGLGWYSAVQPPLVDILIPTYNEPCAMLEATILAALNQDYGRFRVWVLDDGSRDELRRLCEQLGVHYLRRASNTHFKAGNLNHAIETLSQLSQPPEFLAVVDADFILLPKFLERTMALMRAPRTAIVQTPQRFYNPDPFQRAFNAQASWPDDLRSFFELRLPALDASSAATCCGTSFLLRFEAVLEIGGFPVESVSEDTLLSVKLASRGWRTLYLQEGLSFGLSPEGVSELLTQRSRTWLGSTQNAIYRWRSLGRRLCLRARFNVLETLARLALLPASRVLAPLVPIIYWFTGVALVQISAQELARYVAPLWAARLGISWMGEGATLPVVADAVGLLLAPTQLSSFARGVLRPERQRFVVTPKGASRSSSAVHWRQLALFAFIIIGTVGGLSFRIVHGPGARLDEFFAWNLCSTGFAATVAVLALIPCLERAQRRAVHRFSCESPATVRYGDEQSDCVIHDVSLHAAALSPKRSSPDIDEMVNLDLPGGLSVPGKVVRKADRRLVVQFTPDLAKKKALVAALFASRRYVPEATTWTLWGCAAALAQHCVPAIRRRM